MSEETVPESTPEVNGNGKYQGGTVADAIAWCDDKVKRHDLGSEKSQHVRALGYLAVGIQDDEDHSAAWARKHLAMLKERWIHRTNGKAKSGRVYETKAAFVLDNYMRWLENPAGFEFQGLRAPKTPKVPKPPKMPSSEPAPEPQTPEEDCVNEIIHCSLPDGTYAQIVLPGHFSRHTLELEHVIAIAECLATNAGLTPEEAGHVGARMAMRSFEYDYTRGAPEQMFGNG